MDKLIKTHLMIQKYLDKGYYLDVERFAKQAKELKRNEKKNNSSNADAYIFDKK